MTTARYPLERHLSIQDVRDAPPLSSTITPAAPLRYAAIGSRQYRRAPQRFYIEADSEHNRCQPGSIIQGKVKVELAEPLMCLHLKLIFKGEEKIATHGKLQHKLVDSRIFAVRTLLWGIHQLDDTRDAWPILESGNHEFSYMIEMPMVNYPPSFYHSYVSCSYTLFASLERPGERPFQTQHLSLDFQPIVTLTPSVLHQSPPPLTCPIVQKIPMPLDISVLIPQHSFTVPQTTYIPIRLTMSAAEAATWQTTAPISISVKLQRLVKVTHCTLYQEDCSTLGRVEKMWVPSTSHIIDLQLPLSAPHPTMDYSKKFRIQYQIVLSLKFRPRLSPGTKKKQSVTIPIHLATLGQGTKPPAALVPFTHPEVSDDDTMLSKPRFLAPPASHPNYLPPYDPHDNPPAYILV